MSCWPLSTVLVRLLWLRALCGVAEGAAVTATAAAFAGDPALCVAAVLRDPQKRLCMLGGRNGMHRSLGSVLGSFVARFLGGFRGLESRRVTLQGADIELCTCAAVSRDGATLLLGMKYFNGAPSVLRLFSVATGAHLCTIGSGWGDGPLELWSPRQICIAPDDFVFVADSGTWRVQTLTPRLEFHSFVGGKLNKPRGVCANNEIIAVSESGLDSISVFRRRDGAFLRRFGSYGSGDGQLNLPCGLGFTARNSSIAVADYLNRRVSVFTLEGRFVRHDHVGKLQHIKYIACSDTEDDELVVACELGKVTVVSCSEILRLRPGTYAGIAMHGGTVFAQRGTDKQYVLFT